MESNLRNVVIGTSSPHFNKKGRRFPALREVIAVHRSLPQRCSSPATLTFLAPNVEKLSGGAPQGGAQTARLELRDERNAADEQSHAPTREAT